MAASSAIWCSTVALSRPVHPAMTRVVIPMRRGAPSTRNSMRCRAPFCHGYFTGARGSASGGPVLRQVSFAICRPPEEIFHPTGALKEPLMPKFVISPHFRLQEWVAEEKGYFQAEQLDYEFPDNYRPDHVAK